MLVAPTIHPGPLSRTDAEALNAALRLLYLSLYQRFSVAAPLQITQDASGVRLSIRTTIPVPLADGGTGASLTAPAQDSLFAYDVSAASAAFFTVGHGVRISDSGTEVQTGHGPTISSSTSYTVQDSDRSQARQFTSNSAVSVTLPQAGVGGFSNDWYWDISYIGTNTLTITPTTSTIDGAASLTLSQNQSVRIISTGTNYITLRGRAAGSGTVTQVNTQHSITGGPITTTGTINLVNDTASPGNSKYYGTDSGGTRGWFSFPAGSITIEEVDGSPSYAGTSTFRVDSADGFSLTQPGASIARMDWDVINVGSVAAITYGDYIPFADVSASNANKRDTVDEAIGLRRLSPGGRLTLTSGTAVTTSDVTAATTLYYAIYQNNNVELFSNSIWYTTTFAELSIGATQTRTGNRTSGSAVLTSMDDVTQLVKGMEITGTGIPASTTILSIDSSTQITMSANATSGSGTSTTLTCKLPLNKNYDLFLVAAGTGSRTARLQFSNAWTNDTTRADALGQQDGVWMNNATITNSGTGITAKEGRYVGTIRVTGTSGQLEDSEDFRGVWNTYNRVRRKLKKVDTTDSWNYTTDTFRSANGSDANRVEIVTGQAEEVLDLYVSGNAQNSSGNVRSYVGIAEDATNTNSADTVCAGGTNANQIYHFSSRLVKVPTIGYHYYQWTEASQAGGTTTFYGDNADATRFQAGMVGWITC